MKGEAGVVGGTSGNGKCGGVKRYVALARVSSREQEREGFSLEVQEEALRRYAEAHGGGIARLWRIAETASKRHERQAFRELMAYVKGNAASIDGVLFFKVDRAARNLFDYVELERLEADHGVPVVYVSQPTENTPAGRMMRRTLANMAAFYTEQQSLDVREGVARRVESGLFPRTPPYGYRTRRVDGRSLVEVDPDKARRVRRAFELYAGGGHTLDSLLDALDAEGHAYTDATRRFPRSKLHEILRDRAYIGDVRFHGRWHPGTHAPLVDRGTFERVQGLMRGCAYKSHDLVFAGERIRCAHCGAPITGEKKTKATKKHGERHYCYYRCSRYTQAGHPRVRVVEAELDQQVLARFDDIRVEKPEVRDWFLEVLRARSAAGRQDAKERAAELGRQLTLVRNQQDRLLNLRLLDEVDEDAYARKATELRDRAARLEGELKNCDGGGDGEARKAKAAERLFELAQTLRQRWLAADHRVKRELLDIVCLNLTLEGANLALEMRKPFCVLAEGLESAKNRGDRI